MTKISQYSIDQNISGSDKWIGSDSQMQNATKNFTPDKLAKYFNDNQVIDTGAEVRFKYVVLNVGEQRPFGSVTFVPQQGNTVAFSGITSFILSKRNTAGNLVPDFIEFLYDKKILISKTRDINTFGYYNVVSVEEYEPEPDFYEVTLEFIGGNGGLTKDIDFIFEFISNVELTGVYVPYTGATGPVDLGGYDLKVNGITVGIGAGSNYENTAVGLNSVLNNTTGYGLTGIGRESLKDNTEGRRNTAAGGYSQRFITTGNDNASFGYGTLANNLTGISNTAIGTYALYYNTGSNNIAIGYNVQTANISDTNSIIIGTAATGIGSNTVVLGNSSIVTTVLRGSVAVGTTSPNASAILDLTSTTKGFLPPRMTTAQRTSLSVLAAPGLIVYDTNENKHYGWNGISWNAFY